MRKQMIIKIPDGTTSKEIETIIKMTTECYIPGYPIFMFPGWEYEIVEISDPILMMENPKSKEKDFIEAMRNAKINFIK